MILKLFVFIVFPYGLSVAYRTNFYYPKKPNPYQWDGGSNDLAQMEWYPSSATNNEPTYYEYYDDATLDTNQLPIHEELTPQAEQYLHQIMMPAPQHHLEQMDEDEDYEDPIKHNRNRRPPIYGRLEFTPENSIKSNRAQREDEDVRELKELTAEQRKFDDRWSQHKRDSWEQTTAATNSPLSTEVVPFPPEEVVSGTGQKEVVMARPATPVRRFFAPPMMHLLRQHMAQKRSIGGGKNKENRRIRHTGNISKSDRISKRNNMVEKHLISSEENLSRQSSVLKKEK